MDAVCPPQLKKLLFTTAAVDNIDHQTSSMSADGSFHGTGLSLFQHTTVTNIGLDDHQTPTFGSTLGRSRSKVATLPASYTTVPPLCANAMNKSAPKLLAMVPTDAASTEDTLPSEEESKARPLAVDYNSGGMTTLMVDRSALEIPGNAKSCCRTTTEKAASVREQLGSKNSKGRKSRQEKNGGATGRDRSMEVSDRETGKE